MNLRLIRRAALATAALCLTPAAAHAQQNDNNANRAQQSDNNKQMRQNADNRMQHNSADRAKKWSEMRQEAVKASEILRGNMTNGLNPVAQVKNLVLTEDGDRVEYVLYEATSQPWQLYV